MSKPTLFIDGESGTTGLEIRKRISSRTDITLVSLAPEKRKDTRERARLLNECDLSILCLPDQAAKDAVTLITNPRTKIIDASTAHRISPDWVYGFPELSPQQTEAIKAAYRVSNPGCYPTGAIALLRPLIEEGIVSRDYGVIIQAISGYSGGGKELIEICQSGDEHNQRNTPFGLYGLELQHKHIPEIRFHAGLNEDPIFLPSYSNAFYRGMLVHIILKEQNISTQTNTQWDGKTIHRILTEHYKNQKYILVEPLQTKLEPGYVLSPLSQNETNNVQLRVFWNSEKRIAILTACLDNLGKGASGAAVQNMDLMLGL